MNEAPKWSLGPEGAQLLFAGRPAKTPGGARFLAATRDVAAAIVAEQDGPSPGLALRPLTRLQIAALDADASARRSQVETLTNYLMTDLICYRASSPPALVARQADAWDPILDRAAAAGLELRSTRGVTAVAQPEKTRAAATARADGLGSGPLVALTEVAELTGSAAIAFALADWAAGEIAAIDPDAAWRAAHVDEDFQIERWGADEEAAARRADRRRSFDAAAFLLKETIQSAPSTD